MAPHSSALALENPMDGGAWWAAVYGVAQSQTRLKQLSSSSSKGLRPRMKALKIQLKPSISSVPH